MYGAWGAGLGKLFYIKNLYSAALQRTRRILELWKQLLGTWKKKARASLPSLCINPHEFHKKPGLYVKFPTNNKWGNV